MNFTLNKSPEFCQKAAHSPSDLKGHYIPINVSGLKFSLLAAEELLLTPAAGTALIPFLLSSA